MEVRRVRPAEVASVHALLASNGWQQRVGSVERFASLVDASQVADVAVVDGRVVGFVRAITDGLSNGYLSMLIVAAEHRRQGVGRSLVLHAIGSHTQVTWMLRARRPGAAEFFSRLGVEHSSQAMERRRA